MITSVEIPHLAKGQKIAEYKKVFTAATATLKPEQQLACLPLYIHRSEGEKQLAFTASEKDTLQNAFKFLEDLIDGPPCKFTESSKFFNLLPANTTMEGIRSYFFQLDEIARRADIPSDVLIMRFLTNIPGGKKMFESRKAEIKSGLDTAGVANFFKDSMEKLQRNLAGLEASASESFAFPVHEEDQVPQWARQLQKDVEDIRLRMTSSESGYGDEEPEEKEAYPFSSDRKFSNKDRPKCDICNKTGHLPASCYQRVCSCCGGKGHDSEDCTSKKNYKKIPKKQDSRGHK